MLFSKLSTQMWDIGGDQFGSIDDLGILELAQLSLDESETNVVIFTGARGVGGEGGMSGEQC